MTEIIREKPTGVSQTPFQRAQPGFRRPLRAGFHNLLLKQSLRQDGRRPAVRATMRCLGMLDETSIARLRLAAKRALPGGDDWAVEETRYIYSFGLGYYTSRSRYRKSLFGKLLWKGRSLA